MIVWFEIKESKWVRKITYFVFINGQTYTYIRLRSRLNRKRWKRIKGFFLAGDREFNPSPPMVPRFSNAFEVEDKEIKIKRRN